MKARVERDAIRRAIKTVLPPTTSKSQLAVLGSVRIAATGDGLRLTTSDLDLTIRSSVPADVLDEGVALIPAGLLSRVLDKLPEGTVELTVTDGLLDVEAGDVRTTLHTMPDEGWPLLPELEADAVELTDGHVRLIGRVLAAASADMQRPPLWCLHLNGGIAECTDSYRAMRATLEGLALREANIPASAVAAALRNATGPISVAVGERHASFVSGPDSWTVALVEHDYPDITRLLRLESPVTITVPAARTVEAIDRMQVIGGEEPVIVQLDAGWLSVGHNQADVGRIDDRVQAEGDSTEAIGFNPLFLRQAIEACETETVALGLMAHGEQGLKSVVFLSPALHQIVMPTRLGTGVR